MEDKLFKILDDLNIRETKLLLDRDINLSIDYVTRKSIEKSIKKKTGYYNKSNIHKDKINNILGGILMKKKIALALSVGVILSLAGGGYAYAKAPVAYVSMDINPSVELGVNAFDKVVSVEAYNADGEKILEGTNLINTKVDDAVSTVISNAISDGYIKEDGSSVIEITTSTDKDAVATDLDKSLKEVTEETLNDNNIEAQVETGKVALARRDESRKLGITPGKLNLIQKLQELDPTISVEEYKLSSVKDVQKKTKELRKNNKSDETTIDNGTSTDTDKDTNAEEVNKKNTEEATLPSKSVNSEKTTNVEPENNKDKKENKGIDKKEENNIVNEEKRTITNENQNNSKNVSSQDINKNLQEDNDSNSKLENKSSNSNASKSDKSSNSGSLNNDKNKND